MDLHHLLNGKDVQGTNQRKIVMNKFLKLPRLACSLAGQISNLGSLHLFPLLLVFSVNSLTPQS